MGDDLNDLMSLDLAAPERVNDFGTLRLKRLKSNLMW